MEANLDGTDILKPLKEVLQTKPRDGYPRQLFILTGTLALVQQTLTTVDET
jgi:hypothetical protein